MAKKTWDNPIDKTIPWDGSSETDNLPVRGSRVEEFIKNTFDDKIGVLHYDVTNNRYLAFADQSTLEEYVNDPTLTELVLGTFDAPFNYTAEITLMTPAYNAVFLGSTGNYLDFTFDVKNKQGASTGENVNVTYTFIRNASKKVVTETRRFGEAVHFNIDEYLETGTNTVLVGVTGQTTLAATTVALTYQVIDLSLKDEMDISQVYDLSSGARIMEVFFIVSGYGTKTVEWFLDGEQLSFVKSEDEIVDVTAERTKYITLSNLADGIHTLQFRAYTLINGEKFYTDTLYRELIVSNGATDNVIAVATSLPNSYGIINESNPLVFYGVEQYLPYDVRFATRKTANVSISLGDTALATVTSTAGRETVYSVVSNKAGTLSLKFAFDGIEREIPIAIENTSLNIEEITTALTFDFSARGKSNASVDKDSWSYDGYTATFEGFNWNASSGWVDNALLINSGATFSVDIAPLATDATSVGRTLEFEFATRNVENDDAIVCDLRGANGAGLLITASEARLVSAAGEVVSTKFKAGETNRIAFVINRKTGTTYKGLAFIYVNGILSGAINFGSADNYISSSTLSFRGSADAQVELRAMRFYNAALSSENILNNYILYRNTLNEMMEVYYRNDIYEDGTSTFSPDKAQHRLPVMIVTGDIPTLEGATSTSTQITVDVSYVNEQDPTKSFTMKDAAMRIQGTSSLAYPRKNFRIYTTKVDSTIVYDANGNIIEDKLYSFKDGAQPVDCWCLKADYAESSGAHNTVIARIWHNAMYNAQIQYKNVLKEEVNGYVLRTKAQEAALAAGYTYDVRTTIDGFPILLFYKRNANDTNLIFLGKYNFNNDKSTPSVFGFEGIPGFDNSKMQCWETKDNGHALGLFTDISGFDDNWEDAYESRYPDTSTPDTSYLKAFSVWVNGVSQENFVTEKWAHLDVYKVAAYYVYLMRFGAVDQVVKNGFITSEDGEHFFYINYDNDTINGLINTGELRLDPTINRQTIGSDGEYVYAGHDSVLWNLLEADSEFMDIVSVVDNALYSAGLRYDITIDMFNNEQASKWVERVYNQDAEYKYLLPYANADTNNLFMLQGSRSSHRSWWLSNRFSLYDSLFVSGNYRDRNISFKCLNNTEAGQQFSVTAGTAMYYGYGVNNGIREVGVALEKDESHTFTTTDTLNLGDVVKVFAAANIQSLDLSALASRLAVFDCSASYDPALGTKLKTLTLGGAEGQENTELSAISGLGVLTSLQELNIEGYKGLSSLNLVPQTDFRKLYAIGSNLSSVDFAKGAPVEHLELPASMLALSLQQLPYLDVDNLALEDRTNVTSVRISGCPLISSDFEFAYEWITTMGDSNVFEMDSIVWASVDVEKLIEIGNIAKSNSNIKLIGTAEVSTITLAQIETLQELFGEDALEGKADFSIKIPSSVFIGGPSSITEGESAQFSAQVFVEEDGVLTYTIASGSRTGVSIDESTGLLTSAENGEDNSTLVIRAIYTTTSGKIVFDNASITILKATYPTSLSITGDSSVDDGDEYTLSVTPTDYTGKVYFEWSISGNAVNYGYIGIKEHYQDRCVISVWNRGTSSQSATLSCTCYKESDNSVVKTITKSITVVAYTYPSSVTLSGSGSVKDGNVYSIAFSTDTFTAPITDVSWALSGDITSNVAVGSSDNSQCVLKITSAVSGAVVGVLTVTVSFAGDKTLTASMDVVALDDTILMTSISNPEAMSCMYQAGLAANEDYMTYEEAAAVTDSQLQSGTSYTTSIFYKYGQSIKTFDEFEYFTGLASVPTYCFAYCWHLIRIKLPPQIQSIERYAFGHGSSSFEHTAITSITIPENVTTISRQAFCHCDKLAEVIALPKTAPTISSDTFSGVAVGGLLKYRAGADYRTWMSSDSYYLGYRNWTSEMMYEMDEVVSLSINAEDTSGRAVVTRCAWELTSNGTDTYSNKYLYGVIQRGEDWTQEFEPNMGVNAVERAVYYTKEGLTAADVITLAAVQAPNIKLGYEVTDISTTTQILGSSTVLKFEDILEMVVDGIPIIPTRYFQFNETGEHSVEFLCRDNTLLGSMFSGGNSAGPTSLVSAYISNNVSSIGDSLLRNCYNLRTLEMEDNVNYTRLYSIAYACSSLKECIIPEGVTTFDGYEFFNCASLEKVVLPSTLSYATGTQSFAGCLALKEIISRAKKAPTTTSNSFGTATSNYTGRNTYDTGENKLWIPFNATGYDTSYWLDPLQNAEKCGFSVEVLFDIEGYSDLAISAPNVFADTTEVEFTYTYLVKGTNLITNSYEEVAMSGTSTATIEANNSADSVTREISFTFEGMSATTTIIQYGSDIVDGVYIQHFDGRLLTETEWTDGGYSNEQANGVAIKSSSVGFVIAKADASSSTLRWGGYNKTITDIVTTTTSSTAILDYEGESNTQKIIAQLAGTNDGYVDGAPAAEACAAYTFPNGKKGYLGALGQWQAAYNNKTAVVSAMTLIGGTAITSNYYWSSTQYSATNAWSLRWSSGSASSHNKYINYRVRAFSAL